MPIFLSRSGRAGPSIEAVATAVPPHVIRQADAEAIARRVFDRDQSEIERLLPVFANAGIEQRHSCMPLDWYLEPHGWKERNDLYERHALALIEEAALDCLARAGRRPDEIDTIVCVSTTGVTTPSLDARLLDRIAFRRDVRRLPIFGLGCGGGVTGLARAGDLQRAAPESRVLLLVVELCALTFRSADHSKSNIIATALFGDGAAAVLLGPATTGPHLGVSGEHTWPDSLPVMGWQIEDDGFGVLFSRDIPALVRRDFGAIADAFLARNGYTRADLAGYVCHPGGIKVLAALEDAFGLQPGSLGIARDVLRDYGNLSAATVLFVLERMLAAGAKPGRYLMTALGPGFTATFQMLEIR
ncbi:MAG: 3-oxoacyl-[acyl-carrier-protein] synthase III C-terminal domain-containing protein [Dongiaceae bacterium]